MNEELPDCPLYLDTHDICRTVGTTAVGMDTFASAILNAGYRVSTTHCNSRAIKTDAPWGLIWDIARTYAKEHPSKRQFEPDSYAGKLLSKEITHTVVFTKRSFSKSRREGVTRFPENPGGWGPQRKHGKRALEENSSGSGQESMKDSKSRPLEQHPDHTKTQKPKRERLENVETKEENGTGDSKKMSS